METYQERLLEIAGFKQDADGSWSKGGAYRFNVETTRPFQSLDWLETYIMPAVREKFDIAVEDYERRVEPNKWTFLCRLYLPKDIKGYSPVVGFGQTKVSALLAALKELIK